MVTQSKEYPTAADLARIALSDLWRAIAFEAAYRLGCDLPDSELARRVWVERLMLDEGHREARRRMLQTTTPPNDEDPSRG